MILSLIQSLIVKALSFISVLPQTNDSTAAVSSVRLQINSLRAAVSTMRLPINPLRVVVDDDPWITSSTVGISSVRLQTNDSTAADDDYDRMQNFLRASISTAAVSTMRLQINSLRAADDDPWITSSTAEDDDPWINSLRAKDIEFTREIWMSINQKNSALPTVLNPIYQYIQSIIHTTPSLQNDTLLKFSKSQNAASSSNIPMPPVISTSIYSLITSYETRHFGSVSGISCYIYTQEISNIYHVLRYTPHMLIGHPAFRNFPWIQNLIISTSCGHTFLMNPPEITPTDSSKWLVLIQIILSEYEKNPLFNKHDFILQIYISLLQHINTKIQYCLTGIKNILLTDYIDIVDLERTTVIADTDRYNQETFRNITQTSSLPSLRNITQTSSLPSRLLDDILPTLLNIPWNSINSSIGFKLRVWLDEQPYRANLQITQINNQRIYDAIAE